MSRYRCLDCGSFLVLLLPAPEYCWLLVSWPHMQVLFNYLNHPFIHKTMSNPVDMWEQTSVWLQHCTSFFVVSQFRVTTGVLRNLQPHFLPFLHFISLHILVNCIPEFCQFITFFTVGFYTTISVQFDLIWQCDLMVRKVPG